MNAETPNAMTHLSDRSDYRDVLDVIFGRVSPDAGQIEWLLDRIEGTGPTGPGRRT